MKVQCSWELTEDRPSGEVGGDCPEDRCLLPGGHTSKHKGEFDESELERVSC